MLPIGTTVLLWRIERQLSQDDLAKRARLSRPNLSAIERGRRDISVRTLRGLALALEVTPGILVDGIAPGSSERKVLSRERLERIADAVIKNGPVRDEEERKLASMLRLLLQTRLSTLEGRRGSRRRGKRQLARAWLQLSASYPPEVIQSLLQRIGDRERLLRAPHD